ncbi:hypothetical protein F5B21DRAFT_117622 [Xylaria acuta]|nr:hypothetical protein F5B21DRAFT_117622 [Xylaria acuta]
MYVFHGGVRDGVAPARNAGRPGWADPNQDRQMPASRDARCAVCRSEKHKTRRCCKLNGPYPLTERRQGFKRWCPRHLTATHTMDECRQKWDWLRDEKQLTEWLVLSCVLGPAFATNLIDWRTLLDTKLPNVNFIIFPWTPEFALQKMRDDPDFHEQNCHDVDPGTASMEILRNAGWQTENGQEPQFKTFAEPKTHAEQEYQRSQMKSGENRPPTEKIMEDDNAYQIEELEILRGPRQALGEQEVALLQGDAMGKPCIFPILGPLIQDSFKGCHSVFLSGYEFCSVPLILSLWDEWSKNKELESDFVVLAATSRKTAELRMILRELQQKKQPKFLKSVSSMSKRQRNSCATNQHQANATSLSSILCPPICPHGIIRYISVSKPGLFTATNSRTGCACVSSSQHQSTCGLASVPLMSTALHLAYRRRCANSYSKTATKKR